MRHLRLYFLLSLVFNTCICEDWCYDSQMDCDDPCIGPATWKEVNSWCGGNKQSPINIVTKQTKTVSSPTALKFTGYNMMFTSMLTNDGHTVSLDIPDGATVSGGNLSHTYNAIQLHFHWGSNNTPGSEHSIDGEHYPMELHILHIKDTFHSVDEAKNGSTEQAILGFFFEESDSENKEYSSFIAALAEVQDAGHRAIYNIALNHLILPEMKMRDYYCYEGSQTVLNCSETVIWTIFENPIPLSKAQIAAFFNLKFRSGKPMVNTFRPVQPRKGRVVYHSHAGAAVVFDFILILLCVSTALSSSQLY